MRELNEIELEMVAGGVGENEEPEVIVTGVKRVSGDITAEGGGHAPAGSFEIATTPGVGR